MVIFPTWIRADLDRVAQATKILHRISRYIGREETLVVVSELSLDDVVTFDEKGNILLDVGDLQLIALAAAMAAYKECTYPTE